MTGLDIRIVERALQFKTPAGSSRGVLTEKPSFYVVARDLEEDCRVGIGECSLIPGLSPESEMRARLELKKLAASGALDPKSMSLQYPAVRFAAETALIDLLNEGDRTLFPGPFTEGRPVPINGLIWMGDVADMVAQAESLLERGFDTLKMKVGALDFERELECLEAIRAIAPAGEVTLRLDANGGLDDEDLSVTLGKLERLAAFDIHSMEQPIRAVEEDAGRVHWLGHPDCPRRGAHRRPRHGPPPQPPPHRQAALHHSQAQPHRRAG